MDSPNKRGCAKIVECPAARFGCLYEVSGSLVEHYGTKMHQDALMKAVEEFVVNLHNQPFIDQCSDVSNEQNSESITESVNLLAEGLSCLNEDIVGIHSTILEVDRNTKELQNTVEELSKASGKTSKSVNIIQTNNDRLHTEIESIKETLLNAAQISSGDGSYIWKISDIAKKIENARADRQSSIYSPEFYSSPTGYKMCMRLYLNGDGQARRTHLSLFFVIMRGEFDAILTWPFSCKVTFCLYDQTGNGRHIIDSFLPDPKSNSFERPRSAMNIASGIPRFLPLSVIQPDNNPYVRDDSMFIKCFIDFTSMPKTALPFMMALNPALPIPIRQNAIQKHLENSSSKESESLKTDT